jgi:hypothetical protein
MGFRIGPGAHKSAGGAPWHWILVAGIVMGGAAVGWLAARGIIGNAAKETPVDLQIDPRPVITSLQKLGELHTIKLTMKDVLRQSSDQPAEGWLRDIPGGDSMSRWATHNEVLVVAEGSVEAGIDLAAITARDVQPVRLSDGAAGLRVHLPRPVVYSPNVTLRVEENQAGLLWKDENLIPKAQIEASKRFLDAAEKDGIREHARENALQQLRQMEQVVGHKNVEFTF